MTALPHIEARLFGVPLAIEAGKLAEITAAVGERLGLLQTLARSPVAARPARAFDVIDGVAVIPIVGTLVKHTRGLAAMSGLTSYDALASSLRSALADPAVSALMFHIDSGGGEVEGLFDLADEIFAARKIKPIFAAADERAFSAAYILGAAAEKLFLPRAGGVGSVGVMTQHIDQAARDASAGLKFTTLFRGARKNDGNRHEPLSEAARARIERELDRVYSRLMVPAVARYRGMAEADVIATEAGLFFGEEAVAARLADGVATAQDVFTMAAAIGAATGTEGITMQTITPSVRAAPSAANAAADIIRAAGAGGVPELAATLVERGLTLEQAQAEINTVAETRGEIRALCALAGLSDRADTYIAHGFTVAQCRTALVDQQAAASEAAPITSPLRGGHNARTLDDPQFARSAMVDALMVRFDASYQPAEQARGFVGLSVPELARGILFRRGQGGIGLPAAAVIEAALHTTSDFPLLMGDFAHKALRRTYDAQPSAIKQVARRVDAVDFKPFRRLAAGEFPALQEVTEHGEFTHGTVGEEAESYALRTFGRIFGITRRALVNDDLQVLTDTTRRTAVAVAEFEAAQLAGLINANPLMSDNLPVFHVDHGNIAAEGDDIDLTTLSAGRAAMRGQKSVDGGVFINVVPRYLVVGRANETVAEQVVTQIQAAKFSDSNAPFTSLQVVTDPRLDDPAWYLAAAAGAADGLEYAYLSGGVGPQVRSEAPLDYDGVRIRVHMDFGAGWVDFRSWYMSAGQASS